MRERRLPRRHRGGPATGAGARRRQERRRSPRSTPRTRRRSSPWRRCSTVEPSETLKCVLFDVAGHDVGGPGPRRSRGQRGQARADRVPRDGPAVRRRRLRRARVREGLRRTAGLRRRRARSSRTHRSRRERLGDRGEPADRHVTGANVGRDFRVDRLGGPRRVPRGRSLPDRRRRAAHRPRDRARPHLPAGDEVLRAARGDVRGRGRRHDSRT